MGEIVQQLSIMGPIVDPETREGGEEGGGEEQGPLAGIFIPEFHIGTYGQFTYIGAEIRLNNALIRAYEAAIPGSACDALFGPFMKPIGLGVGEFAYAEVWLQQVHFSNGNSPTRPPGISGDAWDELQATLSKSPLPGERNILAATITNSNYVWIKQTATLGLSEGQLATLIFHELMHARAGKGDEIDGVNTDGNYGIIATACNTESREPIDGFSAGSQARD
jgi:hypothetical protein